MKKSDGSRLPRRLIIICVCLLALVSLSLATWARTVSTSVSIANDSSREIRNIYPSPVDSDNWGADLITAAIGAGQSYQLNNVPCNAQQIKLIAEDQDGCFISTVVTCGESSSWTVTNDTARDCGY